MEMRLAQLVLAAQQFDAGTADSQQVLTQLVDQVLRSRRICRPHRGQLLVGIYQEIYEQVQAQLLADLNQALYVRNSHEISDGWLYQQRDHTFQQILDDDRLTQLAIVAQQQPPDTALRRHALQELIQAIQLSGKLHCRQASSAEIREEVINQTLAYVSRKIDQYKPERKPLMAWVHYYKDKTLVKAAQKEPPNSWLWLNIKSLIPNRLLIVKITSLLIVLRWLALRLDSQSELVDSILTDIARASIPLPLTVSDDGLEDLVASEDTTEPSLSNLIRQYLEQDPPDEILQQHIRGHPEVTFQKIACARLDDVPWKTLSESYGIRISSLSSFYERYLEKCAPAIKQYLEENS
jgi:hypothetical protein